jgi:hypothetical protein
LIRGTVRPARGSRRCCRPGDHSIRHVALELFQALSTACEQMRVEPVRLGMGGAGRWLADRPLLRQTCGATFQPAPHPQVQREPGQNSFRYGFDLLHDRLSHPHWGCVTHPG